MVLILLEDDVHLPTSLEPIFHRLGIRSIWFFTCFTLAHGVNLTIFPSFCTQMPPVLTSYESSPFVRQLVSNQTLQPVLIHHHRTMNRPIMHAYHCPGFDGLIWLSYLSMIPSIISTELSVLSCLSTKNGIILPFPKPVVRCSSRGMFSFS